MLVVMRSYLASLLLPALIFFVACDPATAPSAPDAMPDPRVLACAEYCFDNIEICTGDDAQYATESSCNSFCTVFTKFPIGEANELSGNSIECRRSHTRLAESSQEFSTHCPHTGYTGANVCGSWCRNYCDLAADNCPNMFGDDGACQAVCTNFALDGAINDMSGDTLQCRLTFLKLAGIEGASSAAIECPKAQATSAVCN